MVNLRIPSVVGHHRRSISAYPGMLTLLRALQPRTALGRPKATVHLCCDCYRYRARRKTYWMRARKTFLAGYEGLYLKDLDKIVDVWSHRKTSSFQCPECWCKEMKKYGRLYYW
ncbi:hypothetical protein GGR52DRAFT_528900 [Hypoxylon sp. FL1284]|nr:hypothetical protein GGR52DRAFT_528900 [Hypoxylon sp. FL1284]